MKPSQVISNLKGQLPASVTLVAISKYHPAEMIQEAYDGGQRIFGESHVQELQLKQPILPADIQWHFIGHLQTNKVKFIAPYVSLIHSVDTPHLLAEINKQALKCNRTIDCLLQMHIAQEQTKFGFSIQELSDYLASGAFRQLTGIRIRGLMCMASNVDDEVQIAREFDAAYQAFTQFRSQYFTDNDAFDIRSWGMSGDYTIAVQHGSNMVRIGSMIFGPRVY